jgi:hypothetical protein
MYERLLDLVRREAELVASGHLDELVAVQEERANLRVKLPDTPPVEARPLLEEAVTLTRATEAVLQAALAETATELRRLGQGRLAVRAYSRSSISP